MKKILTLKSFEVKSDASFRVICQKKISDKLAW